MKKKSKYEDFIKFLKNGIRLKTKAPQVFKDKSKYNRKNKHKNRYPEKE